MGTPLVATQRWSLKPPGALRLWTIVGLLGSISMLIYIQLHLLLRYPRPLRSRHGRHADRRAVILTASDGAGLASPRWPGLLIQ